MNMPRDHTDRDGRQTVTLYAFGYGRGQRNNLLYLETARERSIVSVKANGKAYAQSKGTISADLE